MDFYDRQDDRTAGPSRMATDLHPETHVDIRVTGFWLSGFLRTKNRKVCQFHVVYKLHSSFL